MSATDKENDPRVEAAIANLHKVAAIMEDCRKDANSKSIKKGNGGNGSIPCTVCDGGTVRYSVASVNGHLWGKCSTKGCVAWMQ